MRIAQVQIQTLTSALEGDTVLGVIKTICPSHVRVSMDLLDDTVKTSVLAPAIRALTEVAVPINQTTAMVQATVALVKPGSLVGFHIPSLNFTSLV